MSIGLQGEEGAMVPEEIEAAKTAAKACKKVTKKIPGLLNKLQILKVQFGTRGRTECADKAQSAATAMEISKINVSMEEFMEESNAVCGKTADLHEHFKENPQEAIASAVSLRKQLDDLRKTAEDHAACAVEKLKLLQTSLNQLCLGSLEVKEEEKDEEA